MSRFSRRTMLTLMGSTLAMPYVRRARAEDAVVNVYNWADYIGETTLEDFTKATGIEAVYDTYSSAEEMQAKMLAGSSGYDVVAHAGVDMPRMIRASIYRKLDKALLPSWGNLDAEVLRILSGWDPGNEYGMPYMWGSVGMTYNIDMVKERVPDADMTSLDLIFKPENAARLADCGISILDSPTDAMLMVLRYLGLDGDTTNIADYDKVVEAFKPIRQHIRTFDNTNYLNAIPNGELCAVNNWSGDYATARARAEEAGIEMNLGYFVPKTGAPAWVDCMCVPTDAPHPENAHKFLEFMLQPEVAAGCTNFTYYANGNAASKAFIDPEALNDPAVYPDAETIARMWAPKPFSEEQERAYTRAWQAIKTGS
ncbi:MAG: polyamine ABC transporter substrate-binding protein [Rhizobiaceae bacterium]